MVSLLSYLSSGFQVTDAGDLEFEVFENDPQTSNVHNPLTVGSAGRVVSYIQMT